MSSNDVCNDLTVDIFTRLPPKSIIRFRSLSKYWHSYLVSPQFLRDHRLRCSKNPQKVLIKHITCCNDEYKDIYTLHSKDQLPLDTGSWYVDIPGVEFPNALPVDNFYCQHIRIIKQSLVIGSCNGILCVQNKEISLWNLSIRRRLIVPRQPRPRQPRLRFFAQEVLGFGFDSTTDDYKIASISYWLGENSTCIYSLKTNSWSVIASPSTRFDSVKKLSACFFNGLLHWVVEGYLTTQPTAQNRSCFILTLNLGSHVFGHILLPRLLNIGQLTTINDCLAVVCLEGSCFWIEVMKEYGKTESWSVLFKLQRDAVDRSITVFQPMTNGEILACYSESSPCLMLRRLELRFGHDCSKVEMDMYVETLELIDKESATTCGKTVCSWTKPGLTQDPVRISWTQFEEVEIINNYTIETENDLGH